MPPLPKVGTQAVVVNADGVPLHAGAGIAPILKQIGPRRFAVIGTAFFVTRYGLMVTAKHVVEELVHPGMMELEPASVLESRSATELVHRRVTGASLSTSFDVAVLQVENGVESGKELPGPANLVPRLSLETPRPGDDLVTYAYPENHVLDFADVSQPAVLKADFYAGKFLADVPANARPFIPHPHFETSLHIGSGASGCPVFHRGAIIGLASRSWSFEGEYPSEPLSSILPISLLLALEVGCAQIPRKSWEYSRIPEARRAAALTFGELLAYGHVNPPRTHAAG